MKKKILFLCTGNSARSQMAEAIINSRHGDKFIAYSAGTNPASQINPYAIRTMNLMRIDISRKYPKSMDVFANEEFDFIIALCNKGKEQCINFIGKPIFAHWDMPDPKEFEGDEMEIMLKFNELLKFLNTRIGYFANLSIEKIDVLALEMKTSEIGNALCDVKGAQNQDLIENKRRSDLSMKRKILFLCTKNSARSQMAETVLNYRGSNKFIAFSAGSNPASEIHPLAVKLLTDAGFDMVNKRPKSIDEYSNEEFDFIITLCDRMKEDCPIFQGHPILAHWGMLDPSVFEGSEEEKQKIFEKTIIEISHRINLFLNIPMEKLDRMAIELRVKEIGTSSL